MNRFANIPGSALISESFNLINEGFNAVEQELDGLDTLSPADRAKLDSVEVGAQVNQNAFAKVNDLEADDPSDELTISGGTGITVTTNPITKDVIITATGTATPGPHGSSHLEFGSDPIPYASTSQGGLMSAADKQTVADMASHLTDTNNPHGVTAAQVGLGNVQNYGIANQSQAEAGTASNVYMTPQRTKDYVDTRLQSGLKFRVANNEVEFFNGSDWEKVVKNVSAIKSVQRGRTSVSGEVDVTINDVNLDKAVVIINISSTSTQTGYDITAELTSPTNLRLRKYPAVSGASNVPWQVIEYN